MQSSSIASSRILEKTLDEVKKSWEVVSTLAENQTAKLQASLEISKTFSEMVQDFEVWLAQVDEKCKAFEAPATLLDAVEVQITDLKACT